MKKNILFFVLFLLVAVNAQADQTLNGRQPREWQYSTAQKPLENKDYQGDATTSTNMVVTGHQNIGNPGMYALVQTPGGTGENTSPVTYYLWVNGNGKLMIASFPTVSVFASFPYGDMRSPQFPVGTVVGSQS